MQNYTIQMQEQKHTFSPVASVMFVVIWILELSEIFWYSSLVFWPFIEWLKVNVIAFKRRASFGLTLYHTAVYYGFFFGTKYENFQTDIQFLIFHTSSYYDSSLDLDLELPTQFKFHQHYNNYFNSLPRLTVEFWTSEHFNYFVLYPLSLRKTRLVEIVFEILRINKQHSDNTSTKQLNVEFIL